MIIGLIGLGEMGSEIGRYLVMNDLEVISVYEGRSEISKKRASKYKIRDAGSIEQFCKISDLVISIIPPDKAVETANLYTSYKNKDGQIYCDLNAISTITAKKIKLLLDEKKIDYVDGAIMGGPPTENYSPRIYLSGKLSEKFNFLNGKGIELMVLKGSDFKASATKMVYASITKGSKALVAGALIAAKKNNVYDELMEESMKAYKGSFKKKNGDSREMVFARLYDLPEKFLNDKVQGAGSEQTYPEGMELVWDLEADNFRVFNWKAVEGNTKEIEIDSALFDVR